MLEIAEEAISIGRKVLEELEWKDISKWTKGGNPRNLVSQADQAVEEKVREFLLKETPDIPLIGEEFNPDAILVDGTGWILDPIDGTSNFLQGFDYFTISLGLLRGGEPEVGVIYNPARDQLYKAIKDGGAFHDGVQIRTSRTTRLEESFVCLEWGLDNESIEFGMGLLQSIAPRIREYRFLGGAAQSIAHVAEAKLDLYIDYGLKIWDYAAGWCIVNESGGDLKVLNVEGKQLVIVGSNQALVEEAMKLLDYELPE